NRRRSSVTASIAAMSTSWMKSPHSTISTTTPSGALQSGSRIRLIPTVFFPPASRASGPLPIEQDDKVTHELKTGGDRGYLRIATEEAFATQEQLDAIMRLVKEGRADKGTVSLWGFYGTSPSERTTFIRERLLDLGPLRIQAMDESGIDKAVLALTSPGTQSMHDVDEAKRIARNANNQLKDACERYPDRFYGMTAVAPLDPAWSAEELRRGKEELGFHGVQINSHTHG